LGQLSVIKNEQHIYLDEKRQHFNLTLDRFSICFSPEETVVLQSRYLFLEKPFFVGHSTGRPFLLQTIIY